MTRVTGIASPLEYYSTVIEKSFYIYLDNQYYISELQVTKKYSVKQELLYHQEFLELQVVGRLDSTIYQRLKTANKVQTNIQRSTGLFKKMKREISQLVYRFDPDLVLNYHHFIYFIEKETTAIETNTDKVLKRALEEIRSAENTYPSEILSFSQLLRKQH